MYSFEGRGRARAGEEPGKLGILRTKLLRFLETSKCYSPAEHISSFPQDGECVWGGGGYVCVVVTGVPATRMYGIYSSLDMNAIVVMTTALPQIY